MQYYIVWVIHLQKEKQKKMKMKNMKNNKNKYSGII